MIKIYSPELILKQPDEDREESPEELEQKEKLEELNRLMDAKVFSDEDGNTQEIIGKYVDELERRYGRQVLSTYKVFHVLIGSTTNDRKSPNFDLEGGIIEDFIRNVL